MFEVVWKQSALDELASLWNEADSSLKRRITVAVNQIDKDLAAEPHAAGESREGERRILLVAPIGILFRVSDADARVSVLQVWGF